MSLRNSKRKTEKRVIWALFLAPLLVPLALLISTRFQSQPVFNIPANAQVLVSRRNPFVSIAGPAYFQRVASPNPPRMFLEQMRRASSANQDIDIGSELLLMDGNYVESRNHHQDSFKVLGIPQISMSSPSFIGGGRIRDAYVKVYLWGDGHSGSIMELWVMDRF